MRLFFLGDRIECPVVQCSISRLLAELDLGSEGMGGPVVARGPAVHDGYPLFGGMNLLLAQRLSLLLFPRVFAKPTNQRALSCLVFAVGAMLSTLSAMPCAALLVL